MRTAVDGIIVVIERQRMMPDAEQRGSAVLRRPAHEGTVRGACSPPIAGAYHRRVPERSRLAPALVVLGAIILAITACSGDAPTVTANGVTTTASDQRRIVPTVIPDGYNVTPFDSDVLGTLLQGPHTSLWIQVDNGLRAAEGERSTSIGGKAVKVTNLADPPDGWLIWWVEDGITVTVAVADPTALPDPELAAIIAGIKSVPHSEWERFRDRYQGPH